VSCVRDQKCPVPEPSRPALSACEPRTAQSQSQSHSATTAYPADPATRPEGACRCRCSAQPHAAPRSAVRLAAVSPASRADAERASCAAWPVRYALGSSATDTRTSQKDRIVHSSCSQRAAPGDPAPAAAHCSLRVRARARASPRAPLGGRTGRERARAISGAAGAGACAEPPIASHRVARECGGTTRARGPGRGRHGGRGWQAQFKKNQNKKKGQSKGGAKPGGEADGKASAAAAGVNSGERVQRVTAAHGSRRGAACCSQQPARAGRFRLRFIIGARTFSAQQALQRGGLGILFPTFSSPPVPNPLALFSLQYLWPVGGSKNRCVPAGGALSSRRSRPRPSKNPGRACCRCAGRIEEMGVTRHQQPAEHLDLESSPQQ
jgi:hypothetical protein